MEFLKSNGIKLYQFRIDGHKEPFVTIPQDPIFQSHSPSVQEELAETYACIHAT